MVWNRSNLLRQQWGCSKCCEVRWPSGHHGAQLLLAGKDPHNLMLDARKYQWVIEMRSVGKRWCAGAELASHKFMAVSVVCFTEGVAGLDNMS